MSWIRREGRRWCFLAGLILVVGLLAACGGEEAATPAEPSEAETAAAETPGAETAAAETAPAQESAAVEGTLSFWKYTEEERADGTFWDTFVADFQARYPDATVEITEYSSGEYPVKIRAAFAAGDEPDVWWPVAGEQLNLFVRAGKIAPLNDLVAFDHYSPASLAPFTDENGAILAAPVSSFSNVLWYNRDLFAEYGLEAPKSWLELIATCGRFRADGIVPIALGNRGADVWTAHLLLDSLLYQYGGPTFAVDATFTRNGASWSDPPLVQAATRFKEAIDADCFPPGFNGLDYTQGNALFTRGDAAMIFNGSWLISDLQASGAKFEVGAVPVPDGMGASHSTASHQGIVGGLDGLAVSRTAAERRPALVAAFLNAFASEVDAFAHFYALISVAAEPQPPDDPVAATLTELLTSASEVVNYTEGSIPRALADDYYKATAGFTSGALSPEEFAEAMAEAAKRESSTFSR